MKKDTRKRKRIFKTLAAFAAVGIIAVGTALSRPIAASAAVMTMSDGGLFDPEYYANTYPDVVAAFGTTDANVLYQHYLQFGKNEGRHPYQVLTDEEIKEKALTWQSVYPEGTPWHNQPYTDSSLGSNCIAFGKQLSDWTFGENAPSIWVRDVNGRALTFDDIKVGDMVYLKNSHTNLHVIFILSKDKDSVKVAEGNCGDVVMWTNTYYRAGTPNKWYTIDTIVSIYRRQP